MPPRRSPSQRGPGPLRAGQPGHVSLGGRTAGTGHGRSWSTEEGAGSAVGIPGCCGRGGGRPTRGSLGGLGAWASGSTGADFAGGSSGRRHHGAWTRSRQAEAREGGKGVISAREECLAALSLSGSRVLLAAAAEGAGPGPGPGRLFGGGYRRRLFGVGPHTFWVHMPVRVP
jgi:hypothetical protein